MTAISVQKHCFALGVVQSKETKDCLNLAFKKESNHFARKAEPRVID